MFLFWYLLAELRKGKTEATKQSGDIQEVRFYSYQQLQYPKSTPANKYIEDLTWEVFCLVLWGRLYHNTGTFGNTNTWFLKSEGDQLFLVSIPWCSPSLM